MKFKDSALAHRYLDDLHGIEVGGSAHNPFNLPNCINVDYTGSMETVFKKAEFELCGEMMKVDVVADGAKLPFKDEQYDYVINSHVIEHFFDPIAVLKEWLRVIKKGGFIFIIAPTWRAIETETRDCTTVDELIRRNNGQIKQDEAQNPYDHFSVWNLPDFLGLCKYMNLNVVEAIQPDDKVGNGFCVILQK
jgi:SAM-dependent methyltransferase